MTRREKVRQYLLYDHSGPCLSSKTRMYSAISMTSALGRPKFILACGPVKLATSRSALPANFLAMTSNGGRQPPDCVGSAPQYGKARIGAEPAVLPASASPANASETNNGSDAADCDDFHCSTGTGDGSHHIPGTSCCMDHMSETGSCSTQSPGFRDRRGTAGNMDRDRSGDNRNHLAMR